LDISLGEDLCKWEVGINPFFCEVKDYYNSVGAGEYGVMFSEV